MKKKSPWAYFYGKTPFPFVTNTSLTHTDNRKYGQKGKQKLLSQWDTYRLSPTHFFSLPSHLPFSLFFNPSPAHTGSGSHSLAVDPVQTSRPAGGWMACPCGGRWSSMRIPRRQPRSTSAPRSCGTLRPCPEARDTPGPPTTAAAWKWARWSSPAESTIFSVQNRQCTCTVYPYEPLIPKQHHRGGCGLPPDSTHHSSSIHFHLLKSPCYHLFSSLH